MMRGFLAVAFLFLIGDTDAGQICASCVNMEGNNTCTSLIECANNEKCFMQNYVADFDGTEHVEFFDYGCTTGQGCPTSLDYIIGKRAEGHHIKCTACCNDTRLCNLKLSCGQPSNTGDVLPRDCSDLHIPTPVSGIHTIYPFNVAHRPIPVYCEFDSQNQVWTVFQRRFDGSVDFQQNWAQYKSGFGSPTGEYWLGNDAISEITSHGAHALRIVMSDLNNTVRYAGFEHFRIANEAHLYRMTVYGYNGTAGDSFSGMDGADFSTLDQDHDTYTGSCAQAYRGGWWYTKCHSSNLNGLYLNGTHSSYADGIEWKSWHGHYYSLKTTTMMIRRV